MMISLQGRISRGSRMAMALLAGLMVQTALPTASAQQGNPYIRKTDYSVTDERSQAVQDMLQELLRRDIESRGTAPAEGIVGPTYQPNTIAPSVEGRDLITMQRALAHFATESDRLARSLSDDVRRVPAARDYITEVLKIRARSTILANELRGNTDLRRIIPDIQALDQSWRLIAYKLTQTRGLSRATTESAAMMDQDMKVFEKILQLDPQIDRTELLRQTAALSAAISTLLDDIQLELGSSQQTRQLLLDGRRIEQQARYLSIAVSDRRPLREIKAEHATFTQMWSPFVTEMWNLQNRYIERGVRRVQSTDTEIRELLLLPAEVNHAQLLHLTNVLKRDVETFFVRAPLKLLIELPRGTEVIPSADMFYGVCQNFTDVATRNGTQEDLVDAYSYIDDAWLEFYEIFRPMKSQAALNVLDQIQKSMVELRDELGVKSSFNREDALRIAGELHTYAHHFEQDVDVWLRRERPSFDRECRREVAAFDQLCSDMQQLLLNPRADQRVVEQKLNALFDQWRAVYRYTSQCRTADRIALDRLARKIMPAMLDLQANVVK